VKRYAPDCKLEFSNVAFQIPEHPYVQRWTAALLTEAVRRHRGWRPSVERRSEGAGSRRVAFGNLERRIREFGFAVHLMWIVYILLASTKIGFTQGLQRAAHLLTADIIN
jgi:hypothetical protein